MTTVCAGCKRVKLGDDWLEVEPSYLEGLPLGSVSHGLCPPCIAAWYGPELAAKVGGRVVWLLVIRALPIPPRPEPSMRITRVTVPCKRCQGTGYVGLDECADCAATGLVDWPESAHRSKP